MSGADEIFRESVRSLIQNIGRFKTTNQVNPRQDNGGCPVVSDSGYRQTGLMIASEKVLEIHKNGYFVLKAHLPKPAVNACREAFWPIMLDYIQDHRHEANRGPYRHFLPMPFHRPCFAPEFFFDKTILDVVRGAMCSRVVADQWGCDIPLRGSEFQQFHVDYQRPLFEELPALSLPPIGRMPRYA